MLNRNIQIPFVLFFLMSFGVKAQLNNTKLETFQHLDSTKSGQFSLQFESFSFLKNNEYFLKVADGYTLFGNQFSPKLMYQPAPHVRIEAGVYAWKDFGNSAFTAVQPIFTVKIQRILLNFYSGI